MFVWQVWLLNRGMELVVCQIYKVGGDADSAESRIAYLHSYAEYSSYIFHTFCIYYSARQFDFYVFYTFLILSQHHRVLPLGQKDHY